MNKHRKTYVPDVGSTIDSAARALVRLADDERAFVGMAGDANVEVAMSFNDIVLTAKPGDDPHAIVDTYRRECDRKSAEYRVSSEYVKIQRQRAEKEAAHHAALAVALASAPAEMQFKDRALWDSLVAANQDWYGAGVIRYADRLARLVEGRIAAGSTFVECYKDCERLADLPGSGGMSSASAGMALSMLAKVWRYGPELQRRFG